MSQHSMAVTQERSNYWYWWLLVVVCTVFIAGNFSEGLRRMAATWLTTEEYSHGVLLPCLAGYLIWRRRDELRAQAWRGHWSGALLIVASLAVNVIAKLASVFSIQQYAFVVSVYGLVVCLGGWRLLKRLIAPMLLLLFMVPLPNFFMNNLSSQLQLISSQLGAAFIRFFGISVFLEGNVIDLGIYKLQVAEACSGLRYLFPLLTMGFVMAYLFQASWWKRVLVFLSSVPLTIFMNSLRIGVIGVMVEHWGTGMAEGFLHEFQGWAVFMASVAIMLVEVIVLSRLGLNGRPWRETFGIRPTPLSDRDVRMHDRLPVGWPLTLGVALLMIAAPVVWALPAQTEVIPQRQYFSSFPLQVSSWAGRRGQLEQVYLDTLMLDDYFIADYTVDQRHSINFYVAWYDSQQAGRSAHSPRSCLPGGGWHIDSIRRTVVPDVSVAGQPLAVNRVLIEAGEQRQLVYYWFQQRGRVVTNEYMVKWYLFWDSLTKHRSDGALVRLITPIANGESIAAAEAQLASFARAAVPKLPPYVPG